MKEIFLFGYYGFDNLGDDLILKSIVEEFKNRFKINVLTYNYEKTKEMLDVNPISRSNFSSIVKAIKNSDIIASGGGSLLQDETSSKSLYFYLGLIVLGKIFNKKIIFLFNGIGPINKKYNKFIMKTILKSVDNILLRDDKSYKLLESLNINNNVEVIGDAVFLKKYNVKTTYLEKRESKNVIISLRPWKSFDKIKVKEMSKVIKDLIKKGYNVELLPLMDPDDYELLLRLKQSTALEIEVISSSISVDELFNKIEKAHFLIGERLHSLIFSSICETPVIGIEYDPKISGFLDMVSQINSVKTEEINFEKIISSIELLENDYENFYNKLVKNKNEISDLVNKKAKNILC